MPIAVSFLCTFLVVSCQIFLRANLDRSSKTVNSFMVYPSQNSSKKKKTYKKIPSKVDENIEKFDRNSRRNLIFVSCCSGVSLVSPEKMHEKNWVEAVYTINKTSIKLLRKSSTWYHLNERVFEPNRAWIHTCTSNTTAVFTCKRAFPVVQSLGGSFAQISNRRLLWRFYPIQFNS